MANGSADATRSCGRKHGSNAAFIGALLVWVATMVIPTGGVQAAVLDTSLSHTCAVTVRGGVKCWGDNSYYGLGDGTTTSRTSPVDVVGLGSTVTDVATGGFYSCALTAAGAVKCWGYNGNGQIGGGSTQFAVWPPVGVIGLSSGVRAIATGGTNACALTGSGGVRCWGSNQSGALGNGSETDSATPVNVVGLASGVVAIQVGYGYSCALTAAGGAKCWGMNTSGQLGDGTLNNSSVPVDVVGLTSGVTALAVQQWHTCAILDTGRVKCWGNNGSGEFGNGTTGSSTTPIEVTSLDVPATAIAVGKSHSCALTIAGGVACWGYNWSGQLGDATATTRLMAVDVAGLGSGVVKLAAGGDHTCASLQSGELRCWGDGQQGQLGNGVAVKRPTAVDVAGLSQGVAQIAAADHHSCAVTVTGGVECWGENDSGELGDGTLLPHTTPALVDGLWSGIRAVATGSSHTCAVTLDNYALCWGSNAWGQLGDGYNDNRSTPVAIRGLGPAVATLALGGSHSCALTTDGRVSCWGSNMVGQLGNGTPLDSSEPFPVTGLNSGVTAIAAGMFHSCAVTTEGGVKCWGQNGHGELGDGTTQTRTTPTDVLGLTSGVVAISAGDNQTCALTQSGAVKCWGNDQLTPLAVVGLSLGVIAIASGGAHSCALMASGGLKCWGGNYTGELGDGTYTDHLTPADVIGLTSGVKAVVAGRSHTCAVTEAGVAKCWGFNGYGQLGNGEAGYALTPQTVVGTPFFDVILRNGFD